MSAKHTPGPWFSYGKEIHDRDTFFDEVGARAGRTANRIATVEYPYSDEAGKATNARLIAAAPELLEALTALVSINEQHNSACEAVIGRPVGWKDEYLDQARAAIAKATCEAR